MEAIKQLESFPRKQTIEILQSKINDPVEAVFQEISKTLVKLGCNEVTKEKIKNREEYWIEYNRIAKTKEREPIDTIEIPKWKKRNWTKIIKQQLKKTMRG